MPVDDRTDLCPHLERGDARCGPHLKLGHLDEAFSTCCGNFHACAAFDSIESEANGQISSPFLALGFASDLRVVAAAAAVTVAIAVEGHGVPLDARSQTHAEFQRWVEDVSDASTS